MSSDATISEPIAVDHECVKCDYNLRGLQPNGRCPECGHDIASSLKTPRGRPSVRLSVALTVLGVLCVAAPQIAFRPPRNDVLEFGSLFLTLALELAATILGGIACRRWKRASTGQRLAIILTLFVSASLTFVLAVWGWFVLFFVLGYGRV